MDKFLLAENPMRSDKSGQWIIHMLNPKAIIRCTEGHVQPEKELHQHYQFKNKDGVLEEWTLSVFHFFTTDFLKEPEEQVEPVLDRAWRWFRSYLESEDNNIDSEEFNSNN
jgi:hypothetical protein